MFNLCSVHLFYVLASGLLLLSNVLLVPPIMAQSFDVNANRHSLEWRYASGGVFGPSLERGATLFVNESGYWYGSLNFRSDSEAVQFSPLIFSVGADIFFFHKLLDSGNRSDDLSLGLAFALQLGYREVWLHRPLEALYQLTWIGNGLHSGPYDQLMRQEMRLEMEMNPAVSLYLGARRSDIVYHERAITLPGRFDNTAMVGIVYRF